MMDLYQMERKARRRILKKIPQRIKKKSNQFKQQMAQ